MSDAVPLPPRPNLEQYKKLAKDLQHAVKSGQPAAVRQWAARLQIPQHAFPHLAERAARGRLADAQFVLARAHGFRSWPHFSQHIVALARANSPVSQFETAADAIVAGDLPVLAKLLHANPELVRARSTREHRSTLLHYVAANGFEDFRQKSPPNIVAIAKVLLDAGADVHAESDAYAGRSTTLGLAATSCHPEYAGVQIALLQLLLDRGATIDGPDSGSGVTGCLHNGRLQAAEFLAARGARLDLESAAGLGRLDAVQSLFHADLDPQQVTAAFTAASGYGRTSVVEFLLQHNTHVAHTLREDGETALHLASNGGHAETVRVLLANGARVDARDARFEGTPLDWALHGWHERPQASHYETVALLVRAGAKFDPQQWQNPGESDSPMLAQIRSDPRMQAALRGE